jgi:sporulation protein YlmC with PRC-barrel domain
MISIPLNAPVECTDGPIGESTAVIVDRESLSVTHFVVKEKESPQADRLVPVSMVAETTHDMIRLNCSQAELDEMGSFSAEHYRAIEVPRYQASSMPGDAFYFPDETVAATDYGKVPAGTKDITHGAEVHATDGKVGQVDELLLDEESGQITHFVMRQGHWWGKKEVVVPVSAVEFADGDVVYLKYDKQAVSSALAIPLSQFEDTADTE